MSTMKPNKPLMAEMLVRHVFGGSEAFEALCKERNVTVEEAVVQALSQWAGDLPALRAQVQPIATSFGFVPNASDCPPGQETHWIGLCEHDLQLLRLEQQRCFASQDKTGIAELTMTIESYIQTLASLRERLVA